MQEQGPPIRPPHLPPPPNEPLFGTGAGTSLVYPEPPMTHVYRHRLSFLYQQTCAIAASEPGLGNQCKGISVCTRPPQHLNELQISTQVSQDSQLNLAVVSS